MAVEFISGMFGIPSKQDRQFDVLNRRLIEIEGIVKKIRETQKAEAFKGAERFTRLSASVEDIVKAIDKLTNPAPTPNKPLEVKFVFKVANDHQDEQFSISVGGVTDAEGEPLPDTKGLTVEVASSDEEVVGVSFDPSTNSGSVHFGHSGVASVTATVTNAKGDILGSGAADFTVTTGDPAAVSDVKLAFSGLTEEPTGGETGGET